MVTSPRPSIDLGNYFPGEGDERRLSVSLPSTPSIIPGSLLEMYEDFFAILPLKLPPL